MVKFNFSVYKYTIYDILHILYISLFYRKFFWYCPVKMTGYALFNRNKKRMALCHALFFISKIKFLVRLYRTEGGKSMNLDMQKVYVALEDAAELENKDIERMENEKLICDLMAFTNTSQIDFSVYTPEKIMELMQYIVDSSYDLHLISVQSERIIDTANNMPKVARKHFACM